MQNQSIPSLTNELLCCMKDNLEFLDNELPQAVSILEQYVASRHLPKGSMTGDPFDDISHSIMILGSVLEMVPPSSKKRYGHDLLPSWAYSEDNPLQMLLMKAEKLSALDSACSEYFDGQTGNSINVMTLDDLSIVSGRAIGSIRNTVHMGDIQTLKLEDVVNAEKQPIAQKVFISFDEAHRWLSAKNAYEQPQLVDKTPNYALLIRDHVHPFSGKKLPDFLKIREKGELTIYYAPFEYVNKNARVVLCGITPGAAQAEIALNIYAEQLREGKDNQLALKGAKEKASFAGPMRRALIEMLDHVGLQSALGISSCHELFDTSQDLVHYTSALKNPVFFRGDNYTGNPKMLHEDILKAEIEQHLASEVQQLSENTIYIPLGPKPAEALLYLARRGLLKDSQILTGLPHPSGANAERIAYFCGRKPKEALSNRTNAESIDVAVIDIRKKIELHTKK